MSWIENNEWLQPSSERAVRWRDLRRFLGNYRPHRFRLAMAGTLALAAALTAVAIPRLFAAAQSAVVARDQRTLILVLAGFLALGVLEAVAGLAIGRLRSRVSTLLNRDLVLQYYRKILNVDVEDFLAFRQRANLFQRIIDAMSITGQFTEILIRGGQLMVSVVTVATVVLFVSPTVFLSLVAGSALLFAYTAGQSRRLRKLRQETLALNYPLVGKMIEVLDGLLTIKALAATVRVSSDIQTLVEKKTEAEYREASADIGLGQSATVLRLVTLVVAVSVAFNQVFANHLSIAEALSLYVLAGLLLQPVGELAILFQILSRLSVNISKFFEILDLPDENQVAQRYLDASTSAAAPLRIASANTDLVTAESPLPAAPLIHFAGVEFSYRSGPPVLCGFDLQVAAGEKICLIGRSGAGKSTFLRLLLGFLHPQKGVVRIEGIDLASCGDKNVYRRKFGVVSQQDVLFGSSLRENLTLGLDDEIEVDRIREVLRWVDLESLVDQLEHGLETTYADRLFSGGQQQRFFVARALLRKPSIVLLDEPTSALDFENEKRVMAAIERLVGDRTTITIAHRLSTVRKANRVVVLAEGRVKASGPHDELYETDDYYRALCDYNSFFV